MQNSQLIKKTLEKAWDHLPQNKIPNHESIKVEVSFASLSKMKGLNREFRKKNKPTDVLSFPYHSVLPTGDYYLGELILCLPYIKKQAAAHKITLDEELKRMAIHGLLHLLGYDHETKMFRLQAKILKGMGVSPTLEWQLLGQSTPPSSRGKSSPKKSSRPKRRK